MVEASGNRGWPDRFAGVPRWRPLPPPPHERRIALCMAVKPPASSTVIAFAAATSPLGPLEAMAASLSVQAKPFTAPASARAGARARCTVVRCAADGKLEVGGRRRAARWAAASSGAGLQRYAVVQSHLCDAIQLHLAAQVVVTGAGGRTGALGEGHGAAHPALLW